MDKYTIDLVQFCNDIDNYNKNKAEKIPNRKEPYATIAKIKEIPNIAFNEQVRMLWNIDIFETKQTPYSYLTQLDYRFMSVYQISYYLYWRTMLRNKKVLYISFPYIKLYLYELIVMSKDSNRTLEEIYNFYISYPYEKEKIKVFLQNILKDFYLLYHTTLLLSYPQILDKFKFKKHISELSDYFFNNNYNLPIVYYNAQSSYKVLNSKFYKTKSGEKLLKECIPLVFENISNYFNENGIDFKELIFGKYKKYPYFLFREITTNFVFGEHIVQIDPLEKYMYESGSWYICKRRNFNSITSLFGYIIKYTEMKLREYTKYKNKISVSKNPIYYDLLSNKKAMELIQDKRFDTIIDDTIFNYLKSKFKKKDLTFDTVKIKDIETVTTENEEKLKVEEYEENIIKQEEKTEINHNNFLQNLSDIEKEVISILLKNNDPTHYLKEKNIMPETIYENINEKALDYFGDNIIDTLDTPYIYEDYINDLKGE